MISTESQLVRAIEEASLNAWPPLQQLIYDGWLLRFAKGYTRRANSINGVYPGRLDVREKILYCEQFYRERGIRPTFRLTPLADPPDLDEQLNQLGYEKFGPTSLQILDLEPLSPPAIASAIQDSSLTEVWLDNYTRMNGVAAVHRATLQRILTGIASETCFITLLNQDQTVACGLGVLEGPYVGLFDIVTDPHWRGRGMGTQLIMNILSWAKSRRAQTAYLQVMMENMPALRLYTKLGFKELYRYWYRAADLFG